MCGDLCSRTVKLLQEFLKICVSIVAAVHDLYPEEKAFWVMFSTEIQVVLYSVKVVLLSLFKYFLEMF